MSDQPRAIIHLDLDAFFASVEVLEEPELEDVFIELVGAAERGDE